MSILAYITAESNDGLRLGHGYVELTDLENVTIETEEDGIVHYLFIETVDGKLRVSPVSNPQKVYAGGLLTLYTKGLV
ncbi:hypothetical protein CCP3SC15_730019 [Gammaproteobacteria bacterium]